MKKAILFLGLCAICTIGYAQTPQKVYNIKFSDSSINITYMNLTKVEQLLDNSSIVHSDVKAAIQFLEDLRGNIKTQYFQQLQIVKDSTTIKSVDSTKAPKIKAKNVKH